MHKINLQSKNILNTPTTTARIFSASQEKDTLVLNYRAQLLNYDLKKNYIKLHKTKMCLKYCKTLFYNQMLSGLNIKINYYDQEKRHIFSHNLNKQSCKKINQTIEAVLYKEESSNELS